MAKKKKKTTQRTKKKNKSLFVRLFKWFFVLGTWGFVFLAAMFLWFAMDLPDITESATFERRSSIIILASDSTEITRYGESKGQNVDVKTLPSHLPQAVLAAEDRRFYEHTGIDARGILRAIFTNVSKGRLTQGGSTITQQLAKNLFLTHERKFSRKIKEAMLAVWLESALTKDEILSAYMNRVYLGSGTYGFEAAAQLYFDKPAKDIDLREAAVLAGLLKAPSRYSPHNNPKLAKERSDLVLAAMVEEGYIKKSDITDQDIKLALPNKKNESGQALRYFTDWVINNLEEVIGSPGMDIVVETTLDIRLHQRAQQSLKEAIDGAEDMSFVSQGAVLAMKPDGAILTMIGGYQYEQSQFNRVTQARRPPGSAFKPIVYLAALENGWGKRDKILDAPITEGEYSPKNFADKYYGEVDLETALSKSMNTATVRLTEEIGIDEVLKTAKKLGITSNLQRDLSLSLGSSGISMLEMGVAYSAFANGGFEVFPYAITRVKTQSGRVLYKRKKQKHYTPVISKESVSELSIMLESVVNSGTGKNAKQLFPVYGKTGTSQENRDAWFAGYSDRMVSVVWLGNDDNSPMRGVTGGRLPAKIFKDVIGYGNRKHKPIEFPENTKSSETGFSNFIGRIISGDGPKKKQKKRKDDYSNLND